MDLLNKRVVASAAVVLSILLFALSFVFNTVDRETLAESLPVNNAPAPRSSVMKPAYSPETVKEDVLWLARCIFSETKRPEEQELVAWVIRNRVETRYRGSHTFKQVVLDPWQFSAFNQNAPTRAFYSRLTPDRTRPAGWQTALRIAHDVYYAQEHERPFTKKTRHFYSERSMKGSSAPAWSHGKRPVSLDLSDHQIDPRRFRFYADVS